MAGREDRAEDSPAIRIEIVKTAEQLRHAHAVRAIVFMEDTGLPYAHAFDGNDFQATHIVLYSGDEPVGALRIRWFRDFAKIERSAFRRDFRDLRSLQRAADFTFAHIALKGYSQVITHATPRYAHLWRMALGFRPVPGKAAAYYHGEPYVELIRQLNVPDDAIALASDVAVLFRTEGSWDEPEEHEQSGK